MKENKEKRKNKRELKQEEREISRRLHELYTADKMVKVNDDWHPTYPRHLASVLLTISWWDGKGEVIFVVAGMDDTSVERRFSSFDQDELIEKWKEWKIFYDKIPQTTNKRWYLERGFQYG